MIWLVVLILTLILVVLLLIWNELGKVASGLMMVRDTIIVLAQRGDKGS